MRQRRGRRCRWLIYCHLVHPRALARTLTPARYLMLELAARACSNLLNEEEGQHQLMDLEGVGILCDIYKARYRGEDGTTIKYSGGDQDGNGTPVWSRRRRKTRGAAAESGIVEAPAARLPSHDANVSNDIKLVCRRTLVACCIGGV